MFMWAIFGIEEAFIWTVFGTKKAKRLTWLGSILLHSIQPLKNTRSKLLEEGIRQSVGKVLKLSGPLWASCLALFTGPRPLYGPNR